MPKATELQTQGLHLASFVPMSPSLGSSENTYPVFLNGHVGEVHKHVVQLAGAGRVLHCAEAAEAKLIPKGELRSVRYSEEKYKKIQHCAL